MSFSQCRTDWSFECIRTMGSCVEFKWWSVRSYHHPLAKRPHYTQNLFVQRRLYLTLSINILFCGWHINCTFTHCWAMVSLSSKSNRVLRVFGSTVLQWEVKNWNETNEGWRRKRRVGVKEWREEEECYLFPLYGPHCDLLWCKYNYHTQDNHVGAAVVCKGTLLWVWLLFPGVLFQILYYILTSEREKVWE